MRSCSQCLRLAKSLKESLRQRCRIDQKLRFALDCLDLPNFLTLSREMAEAQVALDFVRHRITEHNSHARHGSAGA